LLDSAVAVDPDLVGLRGGRQLTALSGSANEVLMPRAESESTEEEGSMQFRAMHLLICGLGILWSSAAVAQTAYLEGHVFNRESGVPIEGAVVVVHENVTLGPVPGLLAEGVSDDNGFFQFEIPTQFPVGVIQVFCRTPEGIVVRGMSSAPLQDDTIRRRDIYLKTPRRLRACLEPQPGDIPPFRR
jgi:hypothetical protein